MVGGGGGPSGMIGQQSLREPMAGQRLIQRTILHTKGMQIHIEYRCIFFTTTFTKNSPKTFNFFWSQDFAAYISAYIRWPVPDGPYLRARMTGIKAGDGLECPSSKNCIFSSFKNLLCSPLPWWQPRLTMVKVWMAERDTTTQTRAGDGLWSPSPGIVSFFSFWKPFADSTSIFAVPIPRRGV